MTNPYASRSRDMLPKESPYTYSRARVLTEYREHRRAGIVPTHAMEAVMIRCHRDLLLCTDAGQEAILEWDKEHARRYLGIIDQRGWK